MSGQFGFFFGETDNKKPAGFSSGGLFEFWAHHALDCQ